MATELDQKRQDAKTRAIEKLRESYQAYLAWQRLWVDDAANAETFLDWVREEVEEP